MQVDAIARMPYSLPCSAFQNLNMDGLLARMWASMALVRVDTKRARPRVRVNRVRVRVGLLARMWTSMALVRVDTKRARPRAR